MVAGTLPGAFPVLVVFLYGILWGSFLNVCIYRLPREKSIVTPPSSCPSCGARIPWWQNIPLISYLFLWGKCAFCRAPISFRYFLTEAISGTFTTWLYLKFGVSVSFFYWFLFLSLLTVIFFIDLEHQLILDLTTYPGIVIGLLGSLYFHRFWDSFPAALLGGFFFYLIAVVSQWIVKMEAMGGGDVKFAAMLGTFLGLKMAFVSFFLSFLIGSAIGGVLMGLKLKGRKDYIPFGPCMALGAFLAAFWGEGLVTWYLNIIQKISLFGS